MLINPRSWTCLVLGATLVAGIAACDSTGPGPDAVDAVTTSQVLDSVASAYFTDNQAVTSLESLGPLMVNALGGSPALVPPFPQDGNALGWARSSREWLSSYRGSAAGLASIPVGFLGKTLVYDPVDDRYEIDPARTGAPANGVRFILYAINPITNRPLDPPADNEIGYLDVIDTSSFPTINVSLTAVVQGLTLVSNNVTGTFTQAGGTISADGFVSDGTSQLNFSFDISVTSTTATATFDLFAGGIFVHIELTDDDQTGTSSILVRLNQGENRIVIDVDEDAQGIVTGTVQFNGTTVALISGTAESLVITNAEGGDLTAEELAALETLFDAVGDIFVVVGNLVLFALFLIGLGLA